MRAGHGADVPRTQPTPLNLLAGLGLPVSQPISLEAPGALPDWGAGKGQQGLSQDRGKLQWNQGVGRCAGIGGRFLLPLQAWEGSPGNAVASRSPTPHPSLVCQELLLPSSPLTFSPTSFPHSLGFNQSGLTLPQDLFIGHPQPWGVSLTAGSFCSADP